MVFDVEKASLRLFEGTRERANFGMEGKSYHHKRNSRCPFLHAPWSDAPYSSRSHPQTTSCWILHQYLKSLTLAQHGWWLGASFFGVEQLDPLATRHQASTSSIQLKFKLSSSFSIHDIILFQIFHINTSITFHSWYLFSFLINCLHWCTLRW